MAALMQAVYVEWEDAHLVDEGTWVFREGAPAAKPVVFKQLGFLHSADEHAIVLTEAYSPDQMAPRTRIPAGMVRRFIELDIPDAGTTS